MKRPVLVRHRHAPAHKGRRERVDHVQSLVINMAINAYPIVTGGVTRQYDQNTVRLIHRSNTSLVAPEIW